ncbi:ABC transporter substrate-binding protein [Cellulosilyticum sp. I15G10I2]|uniref:ABC transporter substrate-binding protein n=1 Tax=Cellulosilyticum sp. I15G10I2 TaxID=1892843 RepID=UPI00085CBE19|nr:ABC transporter substrate-binding protein [Cellulosilyticum sp. I15G10I2]
MKKIFAMLLTGTMLFAMAGCSKPASAPAAPADTAAKTAEAKPAETKTADKKLVVGFAQIGAESEWRTACTNSIKGEAEKLGIDLKFSDAQQKQENQIKAIRSFIAQKVDVIGISPVVESGWETVFKEAKDAGIPVVLVDRNADVPEDLYVTRIGSDFKEEGKKAAEEMATLLGGKGNIVELQGTVGSAAATDRLVGFQEVITAKYPDIKIIKSQTGDFTRAKGKEVMEAFLKSDGQNIDALYAHNDDMAIGAIQAIEEYGLKPGEDIKIVSVDAVKGAFEAMIAGKLNVTVECNPLLGPQFYEVCQKIMNNESVPKYIPSEEGIYRQDTAAADLPSRQY